ncbi:MAG TPA: tetratricopeptide repeat protein, partial [Candidatus Polarisedimenticolia bacterium]|nr:tetratricopeptide repeat protein [Candidatus Polarisedimenticolia bacterium]
MRLGPLSLTFAALLVTCPASRGAVPDPYESHRLMMARSHFENGMKLLSSAHVPEAEAELKEAVKIFPELVDAHIQLGAISMGRGDFAQALERFLAARQSLSDLQGMRHAQEMERQRRLQESIDLIKERIADMRRGARVSDTGKIEQESVRLEQLERERTTAQPLSETPFTPQIHFLVGTVLMKLERFDEAHEELARAVDLRPGFGEAHNNLAVLDFYRKDYARSWEHVHAAETAGVKVDPLFRAELAALAPEA